MIPIHIEVHACHVFHTFECKDIQLSGSFTESFTHFVGLRSDPFKAHGDVCVHNKNINSFKHISAFVSQRL